MWKLQAIATDGILEVNASKTLAYPPKNCIMPSHYELYLIPSNTSQYNNVFNSQELIISTFTLSVIANIASFCHICIVKKET